MKNFPAVVAVLTLLVLVGGIFFFSGKKEPNPEPAPAATSYEYFWGDGCPHCANVEEFFSSWEGKDKVEIKKLEVWYNKSNALLYNQRANSCQIPQDQRGVPLLFTLDGKCLTGDEPIIIFFSEMKFDDENS